MENISVFDMLKIGVGPSSSHTLGPWRAAQAFIKELKQNGNYHQVESLQVDLYGSLSLTGKGHATDFAVMLGLSGEDPVFIPINKINTIINDIKTKKILNFNKEKEIAFDSTSNIVFNRKFLPFHANGLTFTAQSKTNIYQSTFYSIGGGFITKEEDSKEKTNHFENKFPYPINLGTELLAYCEKENKKISEIVFENELALRSAEDISNSLLQIWQTMLDCIYTGCHSEGILPGGLNVKRRAFDIYQHLKSDIPYQNPEEWLNMIRQTEVKFRQIL